MKLLNVEERGRKVDRREYIYTVDGTKTSTSSQ